MTPAETGELLEFCAGYDGHSWPPSAQDLWHDTLASPWVPNLSLDEARLAVAEYYRTSSRRITPADILRLVRDDRSSNASRLLLPGGGVPPNEDYLRAKAELVAKVEARKAAQ